MELGLSNTLLAGDPRLIDHIVGEVKSQGIFDQFRKECIADVDTKPAYQNLRTRVEGSVNSFLDKQSWKPDLNKNQLRETLRKHIHEAPYLDAGVERIVDQVVNPKVYSVFMSQIEEVVYKFLGIERPKVKERNGACVLKDLLPKDLDPVSPESDKNSLKDVSLESIDAMDDLTVKKDINIFNQGKLDSIENHSEKCKDVLENGYASCEEKTMDESVMLLGKNNTNLSLITSGKSDDKVDEDEEDSPTFEPIDIMNLNESNVSNDSHLSGISELTSHRSRSPDFSNEVSQDNFDCSNQDSHLSKVSSDSRLSIVTDFGSSNHALTPVHEAIKEDAIKDKCDFKNSKDNFRAIREFESFKYKSNKTMVELNKSKDSAQDVKDAKDARNSKHNAFPKENSRDAMDNSTKYKHEHKSYKEKSKDGMSSKSKLSKDKIHYKDSKYKEKDPDKKKQSSHGSMKYDKHCKNKIKEKTDYMRENSEKNKDVAESIKDNISKNKEEKTKDTDRKESTTKEVKDLKDLYKEKIRELREKKELTEKEKLNKDHFKIVKDLKDKKDSTKEKKSSKKNHKSTTIKSSTLNQYDSKNNKTSDKFLDTKDRKNDTKDRAKRDEKHLSKDSKNKSYTNKTEISSKPEKQDVKKETKNEKEERSEKTEVKKDIKVNHDKVSFKKEVKSQLQSKSDRSEKVMDKKDVKNDLQSKDKKRKEDKKSKTKDDHSSLRKNSNDRRSTDRDGSNGSNSKGSQSSSSTSNVSSNKTGSSTLTKETNHISNSNSETSDSIEETQINRMKSFSDSSNKETDKNNTKLLYEQCYPKTDASSNIEYSQTDSLAIENVLPLKKRALLNEDDTVLNEVKIKKPKFAKNIHEAKKLMKIRKQMEKQKHKDDKKVEKKTELKTETSWSNVKSDTNDFESVPDEERVQIIEIPDEEYEEPYPERQTNLTLEERSVILLGEPCATQLLQKESTIKSRLSDLELCIKHSLNETILPKKLEESCDTVQCKNKDEQSSTLRTNSYCVNIFQNTEDRLRNCTENLERMDTVSGKYSVVMSKEKDLSSREESSTNSNTVNNEGLTEKYNINNDTAIECKIDNEKKTNNSLELPLNSDCTINQWNVNVQTFEKIDMQTLTNNYVPKINDEPEDCRYFKTDYEQSDKFSTFLQSVELTESNTLEDMIESLGGQVVSSMPKTMAPPMPKRKHSSSPLTDLLINNSNNNNDGHKATTTVSNDSSLLNTKKRKIIGSKKQRFHANLCVPQNLLNGENFVMPLSPESDVSATSEKIPSSNMLKEEKSRHRSSQRYSSDDLYKPRPLFSSSSRRSRRSNQA